MKKRKHICLVTSNFKNVNAQRLIAGTCEQCKKYDYDLSVFSTATTLLYYNKQYINGAVNIFRLINFERYDGIIVDTLSLAETVTNPIEEMFQNIKEQARGPVVNISLPYGDYYTVNSQNDVILREMCRHMIEVHGYSKFCILTGPEGTVEAEHRLAVFIDEIEKHGLSIDQANIFYGDFWYLSGEKLADRIASGEVQKPDAVICASDHMGLGLISRLTKHGYKIPEDIAVIGFEGVEVATLNDIPLTTYEANTIGTAAEAVDYIRRQIEPNEPIEPYIFDSKIHYRAGRSCGCTEKTKSLIEIMGSAIYRSERNYLEEDALDKIDIGYLMESYCYEQLNASKNIAECLYNIVDTAYNVFPIENFYLCLRDNWDNYSEDITGGFPEKMKIVVRRDEVTKQFFYSNKDCVVFDTKEMIPELLAERDEPSVFYFNSVHFKDTIFGYAVLQRKMGSKIIDVVYRNWIRFVCNSLEMIRMREIYFNMSLRDPMTGLINKRGMYEALKQLTNNLASEETIYVAVIDMDGLKYINDTFGHIEGDVCLKQLVRVINLVTDKGEISVRAGGDEFYIIGSGVFSDAILEERIAAFEHAIKENESIENKPYKLSASIGNTYWTKDGMFDIDSLIRIADEKMYTYKVAHKKARQ